MSPKCFRAGFALLDWHQYAEEPRRLGGTRRSRAGSWYKTDLANNASSLAERGLGVPDMWTCVLQAEDGLMVKEDWRASKMVEISDAQYE